MDKKLVYSFAGGDGQLINMAVYNGRQVGLNYVSCSGPRVPVARRAAANAKLREDEYVAFQR